MRTADRGTADRSSHKTEQGCPMTIDGYHSTSEQKKAEQAITPVRPSVLGTLTVSKISRSPSTYGRLHSNRRLSGCLGRVTSRRHFPRTKKESSKKTAPIKSSRGAVTHTRRQQCTPKGWVNGVAEMASLPNQAGFPGNAMVVDPSIRPASRSTRDRSKCQDKALRQPVIH